MDGGATSTARGNTAGLAVGGVLAFVAVLGLVALLAFFAGRVSAPTLAAPAGRPTGDARQQLERALIEASAGIMDSFPDAHVGRVLLPGLVDRPYQGTRISTNRFGMRERDWECPKPAGTTRIVLLGDSFVFGWGVEDYLRCGAVLERALIERAPLRAPSEPQPGARVEVLHLGVPGWNILAECAWLRRQLHLLQPDLVVHVLVANDLDDVSSARGLATAADFASRPDARGDAMLRQDHPMLYLEQQRLGTLGLGLDHVSRERYAAAAAELVRLAAAVEESEARYVVLMHFKAAQAVARRLLVAGLRQERVLWLPRAFGKDPSERIAPDDEHWSAAAHERIGRLLYHAIAAGGHLPALALPAWAEAAADYADLHGRGAVAAASDLPIERLLPEVVTDIGPRIDLLALDAAGAGQVHGGLDAAGSVSPEAAVVLRNDGAAALRIVGRNLDVRALSGATLRIEVEEFPAGELRLAAGEPVDLTLPLPAGVAGRPFVSVRLACDDWVYLAERDLRHAGCLRLERIELLP